MNKIADIILLSYENPDLLKKCVASVLEHTKVRSTLIIVDNNSQDLEVRNYLTAVRGNDIVSIEKVFCEENAGFARGMNKGIRLSSAPFICLLNNDCIVTERWIEEMISVAKSAGEIGLVNPQSSTFGSFPDHSVSINEHAKLLSDKKGKFVELGHAIGFACLVKREVIDKIGYLDEVYEGVCYEDTDFSMRAQKAGYIPVMAEGAYVFHKEQASRKGLKGKDAVYGKNRAVFEERWGKLLRVLYIANEEDQSAKSWASTYDFLKSLARERSIISVWTCSDQQKEGPGARHADIWIKRFSKIPNPFSIFLHMLVKKKKYDAVIFEKSRMQGLFLILRFLHKSELFRMEGGTVTSKTKSGIAFNNAAEFAAFLKGET